MKKKQLLVILALGLVFSMGFVPAYSMQNVGDLNNPLLKPTSSAPVELTITNKTAGIVAVYVFGAQNYAIRLSAGATGTIKVKPAKYTLWVMPEKCDHFGKDLKILKKTKLTVKCGKIK
jgi:hypothetical protein